MDKNKSNKDNHNLEDTGNTLGQGYNMSSYDENYKDKKGMKFLGFLIIAAVIISIVILLLTK